MLVIPLIIPRFHPHIDLMMLHPPSSLQTELRALQMADLDLDSRPPPAAGQPVNLPASLPKYLASPPEHQPASLPTHPRAVQADLTEHSGPSGAECDQAPYFSSNSILS
ncbi:hypothetical protein GOODEAATRI_024618 [Goodea atripinnis]|uniref:Uncharacterized protein n=1 Tax=Goodea atripinnis TaxID=208336 RepID=A0ABV0PRC4_9TELE